MADADLGLPVRVRDGSNNNITSQVNGSQQALDVGIDVAGVQIDPRQIRALTATDVVTANQGSANTISNAWPIKITDGTNTASLTALGELKVDITQPLPAGSNNIGSINQGTSPWVTSDLADGSANGGTAGTKSLLGGLIFNTSTGLGTPLTAGQQASLQGDVSGRLIISPLTTASVIKVDLQDGAGTAINSQTISSSQWLQVVAPSNGPTGTAVPADATYIAGNNAGNLVGLSVDINGQAKVDIFDSTGAAFSATNPLPVYITSSTPGTNVNFYATSASLAAGSSVNLTYTIPSGKTFTAHKFWVSASGRIRADIETSPDGVTYTTYWTAFSSNAHPNISIDLDSPLEIQDSGSGSTVRIVIKNEDLLPFDVFGTISGSYQ
jgi:hypothetical protein